MTGVWRLKTKSATPIVSIAEAKRQTNTVDFDEDNAILSSLCDAVTARLDLENGIIGRPLLTQEWQYLAPDPIRDALAHSPYLRGYKPQTGFLLDRAPLQQVTKIEALQSGVYVDQPLANFIIRAVSDEATLITIAAGAAWPVVDDDPHAWRVTATLGYGANASDVPAPIRQAALMMLSHLYQNREAVAGFGASLQETPLGVAALLMPYRAPNT